PYWADWARQVLIVLEKGGDDGGGGGAEPRWVTFKSENKGGAVLDGQDNARNYGFLPRVHVSYIRIRDFEIRGFNATGIGMSHSGSNYEFSGNHIHSIGRRCSDTVATGIYITHINSVVVEKNVIHNVGPLSVLEGCDWPDSDTRWQRQHHGLYIDSVTNVIVKNNLFYDLTHGW